MAVPTVGELPEGSTFAGYRIEGLAGRGGMGVVYRATQLALERQVALKLLAPELAGDAGFRERFQRESQLAASIDHPNVIPIYEAGEEDGRLFIAMRFVSGTDLRELIVREGRLAPARAARVIAAVAAALDAAHRRGLVHRDVKPANVLIAAEDSEHAYLTDFGLTKHTATRGGLTGTGQWVGTVDYAAPEQIEGRGLDARTDVYALGCVLFEALTGRVPFVKDSDLAKLFAHASESPPAPTTLVPELPAELDAIIARALAKDPDDRFPSAGDLARGTSAAVGERPVPGPEGSVAAGTAAPARASQRSAAAGAPATVPAGARAEGPAAEAPVAAGRRGLGRLALVAGGVLALAAVSVTVLAFAGVFGGDREEPAEAPPASTPEVVATVDVGRNPRGVAADGRDVWVSLQGEGAVARIDADTNEVVSEPVRVGEDPAGITADNEVAWVANSGEATVRRIEAGGPDGPGILGGSIPVGNDPRGIALGAQLGWVVNTADGTVSRLDRAAASPVGSPIGVGDTPVGVFVGRSGVWITNRDDGTVTRIDSATAEVIGDPVEVGSEPVGVAQGLGSVWVLNRGDGTISRLDPDSADPIGDPIRVGEDPSGIAVGAGSVWVTVPADNTVVRVDRDGRVLGSPIGVGTDPSAIAVGSGTVWVANAGDGTVSRIEP